MKKILVEDYLKTLTEEERLNFLRAEEDADDIFAKELMFACGTTPEDLDAKLADAPTIEQYLGI